MPNREIDYSGHSKNNNDLKCSPLINNIALFIIDDIFKTLSLFL